MVGCYFVDRVKVIPRPPYTCYGRRVYHGVAVRGSQLQTNSGIPQVAATMLHAKFDQFRDIPAGISQ